MGMVVCGYCDNSFQKDDCYIRENIKLKHRFYCSLKCQSSFKNLQREFICENSKCNKRFFRAPHAISPHNFCSRSCVAIFRNNQRWGERTYLKVKYSCEERKAIRLAASALGGINRWLKYESKYTEDYTIDEIKNFVRY